MLIIRFSAPAAKTSSPVASWLAKPWTTRSNSQCSLASLHPSFLWLCFKGADQGDSPYPVKNYPSFSQEWWSTFDGYYRRLVHSSDWLGWRLIMWRKGFFSVPLISCQTVPISRGRRPASRRPPHLHSGKSWSNVRSKYSFLLFDLTLTSETAHQVLPSPTCRDARPPYLHRICVFSARGRWRASSPMRMLSTSASCSSVVGWWHQRGYSSSCSLPQRQRPWTATTSRTISWHWH